MVKNPPDNTECPGSVPGLGRRSRHGATEATRHSAAPALLSPQPQLPSPGATATEAERLRSCALQREKPPQ